MDFSKKYDISVYLTEEQLNKRIAEIGAQITEKIQGDSQYISFAYSRAQYSLPLSLQRELICL